MSYSVQKYFDPFYANEGEGVLTVKKFSKDVQVRFSSLKPLNRFIFEYEKQARVAKRSKIINYSRSSQKRLRHILRNSEDTWKTMIDLTYPADFPLNGRLTKKHLNVFLQWLRRKNIKYVWVLEFQERGAPHYHIVSSAEYLNKNELSECWYNIVGSGDIKHLSAGTRVSLVRSQGGLAGYLVNYYKKFEQKTPPVGFENVGRFWGASRNLLLYGTNQKVGSYYNLVWHIKLLRNWYKAHLRQWGIKWKWKGKGFTALDGANFINYLEGLRV